MICGDEFTKWFWTGPWLVTCRREDGHEGEHSEWPELASRDASLGVGHIWTAVQCPAYRSLDPADCTCRRAD